MHRDPCVMAMMGGVRTEKETERWLSENLEHWNSHRYGIRSVCKKENNCLDTVSVCVLFGAHIGDAARPWVAKPQRDGLAIRH